MHLPSWSLRPPCRLPVLPLLAALLPVGPVPAQAEGRWALCQPLGEPPASLPPLDQQDTLISADRARAFDRNLLVLTGEARVERAGQRMDADRIEYHRDTGEALAEGGVRLEQEGMRVEAERARLNLETRAGEMDGVRFTLFEGHAWGEAAQARQENPLLRHFSEASYSTCDRENPSWLLKAREFTLDQKAQRGIVRHSVLRAWDVPVFYFPYLSFSLDDSRKTGFLFPSWGSSSTTGTDIRLPFYWNIAPHRDATLTPRYMAKRGVQLMGEFRYLNRTNSGQIDLEYLPTDKASGDRDRGFLSYRHQGRPARNLRTRINLTTASDERYFEDLGNSLSLSATTHLEQTAEITWASSGWMLQGRAQNFQTVDSSIPAASRPYKRLPQLRLAGRPRWTPYGLDLGLDAEAVRFDQKGRVTGTRLDIKPFLSRPWGTPGWYLTPRLELRHTAYSLQNLTSGDPDRPQRTLPTASLDSGLTLERTARLGPGTYVQTLEPRLFYLYVPKIDQDDIPVFDTGLADFNYQQLFATNRFTGADRVGDANQLTVALSSRLLQPASGAQLLRATLGQILYFRDREVTLPGKEVATAAGSNLVGLLELDLGRRWQLDAGLQWDPELNERERASLRLRLAPAPHRRLDFSYRYRRDVLEQVDVSGLWYLTPSWHLVGRWYYSLPDSALLEGLGGLEYESCCWVARLLGRSYVLSGEEERNTTFMFQVELKGLASLGQSVDSLLRGSIAAYRD